MKPRIAEVIGTLYEPRPEVLKNGIRDRAHWQHYTVFGAVPPSASAVAPGVTVHQYGKGSVLYFNVDPFALYFQEGHRLLRELILHAIDFLMPKVERKIVVEKPLHVEIMLAKQGERLLIHVINYFAQKRAGFLVNNEEIPPIYNILLRVKVSRPPKRVLLIPDNLEIPFDQEGDWVSVHVPRLDIYAIAVIEL